MHEVEGTVTVLLNPEDAATHTDGMFGCLPVVADPDVPPGFARFRVEPPEGCVPDPDALYVATATWEEP